jgi:hypothetical protein
MWNKQIFTFIFRTWWAHIQELVMRALRRIVRKPSSGLPLHWPHRIITKWKLTLISFQSKVRLGVAESSILFIHASSEQIVNVVKLFTFQNLTIETATFMLQSCYFVTVHTNLITKLKITDWLALLISTFSSFSKHTQKPKYLTI